MVNPYIWMRFQGITPINNLILSEMNSVHSKDKCANTLVDGEVYGFLRFSNQITDVINPPSSVYGVSCEYQPPPTAKDYLLTPRV